MIKELVDRYIANQDKLRNMYERQLPSTYKQIVENVIHVIYDPYSDCDFPDPYRIHEIDDGDFQGTLVYLIPVNHYQPYDYYMIKINYGSCSACDTLQSILEVFYDDDNEEETKAIKKQQIDDLMTLSLHVIQRIQKV